MSQAIEIETQVGRLRGSVEDDVATFRGVPYAQPPVDALRFRAAQPVAAWPGVRDATRNGPICPQVPARLAAIMGPFEAPQDEDCLTLTIWSPAGHDAPRPVLIFFHGGGYASGAGSLDWYSGERLAREAGIVAIAVNYRLGALGYLHHPDLAPGNMGLSDQVEALRWIEQNIAAFGGDPGRVTLMGQSGGAHSILCMLAMPETRALVRRAILLSTPFGMATIPAETAIANAELLLAELGIDPVADDAQARLGAVPAAEIVAAQLNVMKRPLRPAGDPTPPFGPVATGGLPGGRDFHAAAFEAARGIDAIMGTTRDEMSGFYRQDPRVANADAEQLAGLARTVFGADGDARMARAGAMVPPQAGALGAFCHAQNNAYFVEDTLALAEAIADAGHGAWVYRFDWHPAGSMMRACHCIELPFMFGTLDAFREAPMLAGGGDGQMNDLSALLRGALARFVTDGDPNGAALPHWRPFSADDPAILRIGETLSVIAAADRA
jgi:para-nitrobenzyl esterase